MFSKRCLETPINTKNNYLHTINIPESIIITNVLIPTVPDVLDNHKNDIIGEACDAENMDVGESSHSENIIIPVATLEETQAHVILPL